MDLKEGGWSEGESEEENGRVRDQRVTTVDLQYILVFLVDLFHCAWLRFEAVN